MVVSNRFLYTGRAVHNAFDNQKPGGEFAARIKEICGQTG